MPLFCVSNSPVPKLRWRKVDGLMPSKAGLSAEGPTLTLPDLSFDDEGIYECEAYNSKGSDTYQGRINVQGDRSSHFSENPLFTPFGVKYRLCQYSCLQVM